MKTKFELLSKGSYRAHDQLIKLDEKLTDISNIQQLQIYDVRNTYCAIILRVPQWIINRSL
jgi:hypothetical protein